MYAQGLTATLELNAGHFDTFAFMADTPMSKKDWFATTPVLAAVPACQPVDEEELHTSFEQAISDRLLVINKQLGLRSSASGHTQRPEPGSKALSRTASVYTALPVTEPLQWDSRKGCSALRVDMWWRSLVSSCLALMLILAGFDLMGLLVLLFH